MTVVCRAWPIRSGDRLPKTAFTLDWVTGMVRCPNAVTVPLQLGATVRFPEARCAGCPLRPQCPGNSQGRSLAIHCDERLLQNHGRSSGRRRGE